MDGGCGLSWPSPGCLSVFDLDDTRAKTLVSEVVEDAAARTARGQVVSDTSRDDGSDEGLKIHSLDVSHGGSVTDLSWLDDPQWHQLESLVVDNNRLESIETCPILPGLRTLSLNLNSIIDIDELVDDLADRFENLTYLSLLGNPCCPAELTGGNDAAYSMYSRLVTKRLPNLKYLDTVLVSSRQSKGRTSNTRQSEDRLTLLRRSASDLLRRSGSRSPDRRESIGALVIRKRMDAAPISKMPLSHPLSRINQTNYEMNGNCDDDVRPSAIDVANEKLEQLQISQSEYEHIAAMIRKIELAEDDSSDSCCSSPDGSASPDLPGDAPQIPSKSTDPEFGALLHALESQHSTLTMAEERALALALDKADAVLAEELAELQTQARILEIERQERVHGLHDPSEHPQADDENEDFRATDGFSKNMAEHGYRHVDSTRRSRRLTYSQLPPMLDLDSWDTPVATT